jgi:enoyl-CoA hydratase
MSTVRLESAGALAVLRMDKARGNALDDALVADLASAFRQAEDDPAVRGVLLASAHPKLFCPGLDLVSLVEYDPPALQGFMGRFADLVAALFGSRKPVVAAVGGHAVAGGCILALTADLRVLSRSGAQIGLNEVRVGVPLPWGVTVMLRACLPPTSHARVALLGLNFSGEEAVQVGLVDALADPEGFEDACLERLREMAEKDPFAFGTTKAYLRADALAEMRERESEGMEDFLRGWFSEGTQERVRRAVAGLTRPR